MGLAHNIKRAMKMDSFEEMLYPKVPDWPMEETVKLAKMALVCAELCRRDRPDLASVVLPELNRLQELADSSLEIDWIWRKGLFGAQEISGAHSRWHSQCGNLVQLLKIEEFDGPFTRREVHAKSAGRRLNATALSYCCSVLLFKFLVLMIALCNFSLHFHIAVSSVAASFCSSSKRTTSIGAPSGFSCINTFGLWAKIPSGSYYQYQYL